MLYGYDRGTGDGVIMKVSPPTDEDGLNNSLMVEFQIYQKIINPMLLGAITPHVTRCLGTFRYADFFRALDALSLIHI